VCSARAWPAPVAAGPVDATVTPPGSKSLMARALVLAALADEPTTVHAPLVARDSLLMASALRALGNGVDAPEDGPWRVTPAPAHGERAPDGADVDCGLSGTVMRFVPPLAALTSASVRFDGDQAARLRPMAATLDALRSLGVALSPSDAAALPFTVHGTGAVHGGVLQVDASGSSQVVSGLLMASCRFVEGVTVRPLGPVPSAPHLAMTVEALRLRGIEVRTDASGVWQVLPGVPTGGDVVLEPDLSNALPFLAAALVTGGRVQVPRWPPRSLQPVAEVTDLLRRFGAQVTVDGDALTVQGPPTLHGLGTVDLSSVSELVPTVAALAALAQTPTTITGVAHIRGHETDRLAALRRSLTTLGGRAVETADGLVVEPSTLHAGTVASEGDHRLATFAAVLGLRIPGIVVDDISVTGKTMPRFTSMWRAMLS
jgi:3-phosphoshikimate 1-carboxyvinyltransferase